MTLAGVRRSHRDISPESVGPFQDCSDVLHLVFFFDGTGNNRDADAAEKKWSNISRLFDAARDEPPKGIYRLYTSGVGTKLNAKESAITAPWLWVRDSNAAGGGMGIGANARLDKGADDLSEALHRALLINARKAGGALKSFADKSESESFQKLNRALANHRLIKIINISVFGFSRGAALARAFTNRLIKQCKNDGRGGLTLEGYPVRFVFLGVFDTVASFGLPAHNGVLPWGGVDLRVSEYVERCVHYVAGHELRFSFPVDLIRENGSYGRHVERVYPGAHSDVGGGYLPVEQIRLDHLARIPLCDMLHEACGQGVRLLSLKNLKQERPFIYQRMAASEDITKAYKSYAALCNASGTVEQQIRRHMELYYACYGTLKRRGGLTPTLAQGNAKQEAARREYEDARREVEALNRKPIHSRADAERYSAAVRRQSEAAKRFRAGKEEAESLAEGLGNIHEEAEYLQQRRQTGKQLRAAAWHDRNRGLLWQVRPEPWMLDAYSRQTVPDEIVDFFERYVHDSKAGFGMQASVEPFSYFRPRGVFEQLTETGHAPASDSPGWPAA